VPCLTRKVLDPGAGDQLLVGPEQVPLVPGAGVLARDERPLRRALDRLEQRRDRDLGDLLVRRVRLALRPDDVGLPVVEEELGDLADLPLRPRRVRHVGQADGDLVAPGALDLGLGDTELVDALAHDVERPVDRVAVDRRLLRRLGLVDQRDAALQVEAEAGLLRRDDEEGRRQEARDEQQDEEIAATVGHGN
jgi:hypothetical protein